MTNRTAIEIALRELNNPEQRYNAIVTLGNFGSSPIVQADPELRYSMINQLRGITADKSEDRQVRAEARRSIRLIEKPIDKNEIQGWRRASGS